MSTVRDWLRLHGLTMATVDAALVAYATGLTHRPEKTPCSTAAVALGEALSALRVGVAKGLGPRSAEALERAVIAGDSPRGSRPATLDRWPDGPLVRLHFDGSPDSRLELIHEFGHALHVLHARGAFVAPVAREICAFVFEAVVLGSMHAPELIEVRDKRSAEHVAQGLPDADAEYHYDVNYPVAAAFASRIAAMPDAADRLLQLMSARDRAMDLVAEWCPVASTLPPVSLACASPRERAYRLCGAAALLEIDAGLDDPGPGPQLGAWVDRVAATLRDGSFRLLREAGGRPWGYETPEWRTTPFGFGAITTEDDGEGSHVIHKHMGWAVDLLGASDYHRTQKLCQYLAVEIIPPFLASQVRFWLSPDGIPVAFATWAFLTADCEEEVLRTGRALRDDEWTAGHRLFFNDWVSPYGHLREVVHDMTHHVFPDHVATSLRRHTDGSKRRVNRWTGARLRAGAA